MYSLVINTNKEADFNLFISLADRLKIKSKVLTDEEMEEIGLLNAMKEGKNTQFVPRSQIFDLLKKNAK